MAVNLLSNSSCQCATDDLALFEVPPTQVAVLRTFYDTLYPYHSLDTPSIPVDFRTVSSEHYTDLSKSYLITKLRIIRRDGTDLAEPSSNSNPIPDASKVWPIPYIGATLYRDIEVYLGNKLVASSENQNHYLAYLETLFSLSKSAQESTLSAAFWYPDSAGKHDDTTIAANWSFQNIGAQKRFQISNYGDVFQVYSPIHLGIMRMHKLIPNGVHIRVRLLRNKPEIYLQSPNEGIDYELAINSIELHIARKEISSEVRESQEKALLTKPAIFPYTNNIIRHFLKPIGATELTENSLYIGIKPTKVYVGFVNATNFNGSYPTSPFNLLHMNSSELALKIDGHNAVYSKISTNFNTHEYTQAYITLLSTTGHLWSGEDAGGLTLDQYKNGNTLFAWDLTNTHSGQTWDPISEVTLSLEVKLRQATTHSVVLLVFMSFHAVLEMNQDRSFVAK